MGSAGEGLGTAGLGSTGLGSTGLGTAGLGDAGLTAGGGLTVPGDAGGEGEGLTAPYQKLPSNPYPPVLFSSP